ncbi:MAG TPA: helix-turn-helix domain-containing protein [Acetobacteraceae bacterium]|nr:helix-turn-helix domain-containing protein [Acetobacteraceae bacterium]
MTPHQIKEALRRCAAGEPMRDIARTYTVSHSTISRLPVGGATSSFTPMPPAK